MKNFFKMKRYFFNLEIIWNKSKEVISQITYQIFQVVLKEH